jgi:hypothetical protein
MARMRKGVHPILEAEANRILKEGLAGTTRPGDKGDILTPWKKWDRTHREVFSSTGTVDPSSRSGIFSRAWNPSRPDLNSRPNGLHSRPLDSTGGDYAPGDRGFSLAAFIEENRDVSE